MAGTVRAGPGGAARRRTARRTRPVWASGPGPGPPASEAVLDLDVDYPDPRPGPPGYSGSDPGHRAGRPVHRHGDAVRVSGAAEVLLLTQVNGDGLAGAPRDYRTLLAEHTRSHRAAYGQVSLDLGASPADRAQPVGELLARQAASPGRPLPALLEKLFDSGPVPAAGGQRAAAAPAARAVAGRLGRGLVRLPQRQRQPQPAAGRGGDHRRARGGARAGRPGLRPAGRLAGQRAADLRLPRHHGPGARRRHRRAVPPLRRRVAAPDLDGRGGLAAGPAARLRRRDRGRGVPARRGARPR